MHALIASDVHGSMKAMAKLKKKARKADILIIAGDVSIFGHGLGHLLRTLNKLHKPVLVISGNHEDANELQHLCLKLKYVYYMNNKVYGSGNCLFYGYPTNGFTHRDRSFETHSVKFVKAIRKYKPKKTILISHAPVYGTRSDRIMNQHCGNKSIREFCIRHHIDYCFCGHIHEAARTTDKLKNTIVVNPGPYGMVVKI